MLRKNVASQVLTFDGVNATTGAALVGASVTTLVALDGTQSASAGTLTELGGGQYKYVPSQGETNGTSVGFSFTATNMVPVSLHCFTLAADPTDAVRFGLSALPNAAANAAGGLPVSSAGALDLDEMNVDIEAIQTSTAGLTFTGANKVDASVRDWVGDTIPARTITGVPKVDLQDILGTIVSTPATAGILDVNVKNMNNVAGTPITTIKAVQGLATDGVIPTATNLTNAPTAGDFTATMKTSVTTAATAATPTAAAVTGAVGSVTGAVGSVTGAVGSVTGLTAANLDATVSSRSTYAGGAVASVTGAVGSVTGLTASNLDATISSRTKPADTQAAVTLVTTLTTYTGNTPQTGDAYGLLNGTNTELAAVPASTASIVAMVKWVFLLARNKLLQTSTTSTVKANDGTTTVGSSTVSDDATTGTRGAWS